MTFDISQFQRMPERASKIITRRMMWEQHWRRRQLAYMTAAKVLPLRDPQHHRALGLADAAETRAQAYQALLSGNAEHAVALRACAAMQGARAKAMVAL